MKTLITDWNEPLHEPLWLGSSTELRGGVIRLADDYQGGWQQPPGQDRREPYGAVRLQPGAHDVVIDRVRFEGPPISWWEARLQQVWTWPTRGLAIVDGRSVILHNCCFTDWIAEGIYARDFLGLQILNCEVERCNAALALDWPRLSGNRNLVVDGLLGIDMRGVDNLNAIGESILYPGGKVGSNFVWGSGLVVARVRRVRCAGEGKGVKLTHSAGLALSEIRVPNIWLGGVEGTPEGWRGPIESKQISLRRSVIGESTFGQSRSKLSDPAAVVVSGVTVDECQFEDVVMLAPRPGPLYAPWFPGGGPSPNFSRFQALSAQRGFRLRLGSGCRFIDLHGDHPEPTWIIADTGASVIEDPSVPRERYTPHWEAP